MIRRIGSTTLRVREAGTGAGAVAVSLLAVAVSLAIGVAVFETAVPDVWETVAAVVVAVVVVVAGVVAVPPTGGVEEAVPVVGAVVVDALAVEDVAVAGAGAGGAAVAELDGARTDVTGAFGVTRGSAEVRDSEFFGGVFAAVCVEGLPLVAGGVMNGGSGVTWPIPVEADGVRCVDDVLC